MFLLTLSIKVFSDFSMRTKYITLYILTFKSEIPLPQSSILCSYKVFPLRKTWKPGLNFSVLHA